MDTLLEEPVALKEFFPNDLVVRVTNATVRAKSGGDQPDFQSGLRTFLQEARIMARFRHRNIVHVRRFFELHGTGYIVQDYEAGQTLSERLNRGPIEENDLRKILGGILDGLELVHERAILHRDLKPDNIILRKDGSPVLIDFGAARDFASRNSRSVTAIASGSYTSPEQWGAGGQQGPWSDLYSLGAIAYRCVTGTAPPISLHRLRTDPLVPAAVAARDRYDPALLDTIDCMLAIDETQRPVSVSAVKNAMSGLPGRPSAGRGPEIGPERRPRSTVWRVAAGIVIALGAGVAGYWFYTNEQKAKLAEIQKMNQLLQEAAFDQPAIENMLHSCGSSCPADIKTQALSRLDLIAAEQHAYQAAQNDPAKLRAYVRDCKACVLKSDAEKQVQLISRKEERDRMARAEENAFQAARDNEQKLRKYLSTCEICSSAEAARQALSSLQVKFKSGAEVFSLRVCNHSIRKASVAVMGRTILNNNNWHVEGWWSVAPSQCDNLKSYIKGNIYLFAQDDGNPSFAWKGTSLQRCVAFPGPFDRADVSGYTCKGNETMVSFSLFSIFDSTFTWDLNQLN